MDDGLKKEVFDANLMLKELELVIFTWGNVSAIDRDTGEVVIKPSGVPYDTMGVTDLVMVDMDGNTLAGAYKPSSDLATHLEIYRRFPGCSAVVHTHSRMATAWAQAGLDLPAYGTTHADYFYGPIPCTRILTKEEIQGAYELETGRVIGETFEQREIDPAQVPGVLVNGHGPFTWGPTPEAAVHNTVVLEEIATMAFHSRCINPQMGPIAQGLLDRHFLRKHGADAYYGQQ
jgi:L-ribulose-5-phosphate 4-epimerase